MLLAENVDEALDPPAIQVFATDLDEQAVAIAREAFYTNSDVADVSEERLQRFFMREPGGYRVRRELRETVLFATHDVIRDPPFSHLDLISCRNLLIYLNRTVQERVIETFHFALRPGGFLFLGQSETPESSNDLFMPVDKAAHIYESRTVTSRLPLPGPAHPVPLPAVARPGEARVAERITPGELHQRLLERYGPPSLVVTEDHHVVHMSQSVGRFLQVRGGEPSRDVTRLARPELRPALRTALHQAVAERRNIEAKDVLVALDEGERRVDICVSPVMREDDPARGYLLVSFDAKERRPDDEAEARGSIGAPEPLNRQLEDEVSQLRQQLRSTVEQFETQVEEAKASNEELQALNEELRSSA